MIIGLVGYAGSGKDSVAESLTAQGWKRLAFGDKVKECLYALNPRVRDLFGTSYTLRVAVDIYGWDTVKQWPEVRELLQRMGTEVGRDIIGENLWVNLLVPEILEHRNTSNIAITDVRFPNEAYLVEHLNGWLVRVVRPGNEPPNEHASETNADKMRVDHTICNDGSLQDLETKVQSLLASPEISDRLI